MKRVFLIDVLECPCGGQRKIIAMITEPEVIRAIQRALHLPEDLPSLGHALDPPDANPVEDMRRGVPPRTP
jgi:hypothetical protein